jgi:hypothetical protein
MPMTPPEFSQIIGKEFNKWSAVAKVPASAFI